MSKSKRTSPKAALAVLALAGAASVSATTVSIPLNAIPSLIETTIFNDSGVISSIEFDLSKTVTSDGSHAVFGGLYGALYFSPAGISQSSLVGNEGDAKFGFNFSEFHSGQSFTFGWDPDSAINPNFGALPKDLVGTKVRAFVEGQPIHSYLYGVMTLDNAGNLGTTLAAVPEPETWALMLAGLALVGGAARKRQAR